MSKSLKDQNKKWLWIFVSLNAIVFALALSDRPPGVEWIEATWQKLSSKTGVAAAVVPFVTLVLGNLIPSLWKARLVFWRIKDPLPGSRVFSEMAKDDPRIDLKRIREAVGGTFPRSAEKQNALWYQLYKKQSDKPTVVTAHREFLLARDMAAVSALLIIAMGFLIMALPAYSQYPLGYLCVLVVMFLLTSIAAQNLGNRFTLNVLAEECAERGA
ncbi:MAG: hypothetical protein WC205_19410 [Opitutaceae bacterium]|jgi:hypothetical protein